MIHACGYVRIIIQEKKAKQVNIIIVHAIHGPFEDDALVSASLGGGPY